MDIPVAVLGVEKRAASLIEARLRKAGYRTERPDDLPRWLAAGGVRAIVLPAENLEPLVPGLRPTTETLVVALVPELTADWCRHALRWGAHGVAVSDDASEVVNILSFSISGWTILPTIIVQEIVSPPPAIRLTREEMRIVWKAAHGMSVKSIATEEGYSERAIHRLFHRLEQRVGVDNRSQLIAWTGRIGIYP